MANEILALAVVVIFAVNAFLYYQWKALKDEMEERNSSRKITYVKGLTETVYSTGTPASSTVVVTVKPAEPKTDSGLVAEAKSILKELKEIAENDVVQVHQKVVSTNHKVAA